MKASDAALWEAGGVALPDSPAIFQGAELWDRVRAQFPLAVSLVLVPPLLDCVVLTALNTSVRYWIGSWPFVATSIVVATAVLSAFIPWRCPNWRALLFIRLVIQIAAVALLCKAVQLSAATVRIELESKDCGESLQKLTLESAWQAAAQLVNRCPGPTYGNFEAGWEAHGLNTDCPEYREGLADWGPDWAYLQSLERDFHCSGWCTSKHPVWFVGPESYHAGVHDRCSLVAGEWFHTGVERRMKQAFVYCLLVALVVAFVMALMPRGK